MARISGNWTMGVGVLLQYSILLFARSPGHPATVQLDINGDKNGAEDQHDNERLV